jgi:hypothetical protein
VLSGVSVLRGVTAADQATDETGAEMDPSVPELDTPLAYVSRWLDRRQAVEVLT